MLLLYYYHTFEKSFNALRFLLIIGFLVLSTHAFGNDAYRNKLDRINYLVYEKNELAIAETELLANIPELKKLPKSKENITLLLQAKLLYCQIMNIQSRYQIAYGEALEIIKISKEYSLPVYTYKANLEAALINEHYDYMAEARQQLDDAYTTALYYELDSILSTYYVRKSSFYRYLNKRDSSLIMAQTGLEFALRYKNEKDEADCRMLIGMMLPDEQYVEAIQQFKKSASFANKTQNHIYAFYHNWSIAELFIKHGIPDSAELYKNIVLKINREFLKDSLSLDLHFLQFKIFEMKDQKDSALTEFIKYHQLLVKGIENDKSEKINEITNSYKSKEQEAIIKIKNNWLIFLGCISALVLYFSIILYQKNKKITSQNDVICKQNASQLQVLAQKETILQEMHHRVKNNLQNVISILEMQKESINFNSIDELIRGNQNRIHSMALLHKKLNMSGSSREINLPAYLKELTDLLMESYHGEHKQISLILNCTLNTITLDQALPLGLITVELVSNSMKHAFKGREQGIISIEVEEDKLSNLNTFFYMDNGAGFDFDAIHGKGLGLEIIKGLTDQLDAKLKWNNNQGFCLSFSFK